MDHPAKVQVITIGRAPENWIVLPDSHISAFHAELHILGDRAVIRDLDSTNGTSLGTFENRIWEAEVEPDDIIFFGASRYRVRDLILYALEARPEAWEASESILDMETETATAASKPESETAVAASNSLPSPASVGTVAEPIRPPALTSQSAVMVPQNAVPASTPLNNTMAAVQETSNAAMQPQAAAQTITPNPTDMVSQRSHQPAAAASGFPDREVAATPERSSSHSISSKTALLLVAAISAGFLAMVIVLTMVLVWLMNGTAALGSTRDASSADLPPVMPARRLNPPSSRDAAGPASVNNDKSSEPKAAAPAGQSDSTKKPPSDAQPPAPAKPGKPAPPAPQNNATKKPADAGRPAPPAKPSQPGAPSSPPQDQNAQSKASPSGSNRQVEESLRKALYLVTLQTKGTSKTDARTWVTGMAVAVADHFLITTVSAINPPLKTDPSQLEVYLVPLDRPQQRISCQFQLHPSFGKNEQTVGQMLSKMRHAIDEHPEHTDAWCEECNRTWRILQEAWRKTVTTDLTLITVNVALPDVVPLAKHLDTQTQAASELRIVGMLQTEMSGEKPIHGVPQRPATAPLHTWPLDAAKGLRTHVGDLWRVPVRDPEKLKEPATGRVIPPTTGSPVLNEKDELIGLLATPSLTAKSFGIPSKEPLSVDLVPLSEIRTCLESNLP